MRNQISSFFTRTSEPEKTESTELKRPRHRRWRMKLLAAGAVIAAGATVGTGFAVQAAVAAQQDSIAETQLLADSQELEPAQLAVYGGILGAHAAKAASDAITAADATIAAAEGKTDAAELQAAVDALDGHTRMLPERVFELVGAIAPLQKSVSDAIAEFDRIAAEEAAAAQAAAEAEAAERAAAEAAVAARPSAPSNPSEAQAIARDMISSRYGWGEDQFGCLVALWNKESGWNAGAYNSSSGATGIPQALPGSKMASHGDDWATNPATQISWGIDYIAGRYGSPCAAWEYSQSVGWY